MPTQLVAKIAPQRAAQYAALAEALALPELRISPLGPQVREVTLLTLAGHPYLRLTLDARPDIVPAFATLSEWFDWFDALGGEPGPLLRPIEAQEPLRLPPELVEARRYRGKTNELFTHFLVNVARWTHGGAPRWLLDPMAGGGTTLFVALRLGLHAMGVERDKAALSGIDTFVQQFLQTARLRHQREPQKRRVGFRVRYRLPDEQRLVLALGDAREADELLDALPGGPRPDLIVADLPYSIQHNARTSLQQLLQGALPVWHRLAAPGAVLALAWNATRLPRDEMRAWVAAGGWEPVTGGPYDAVAHRVDRVIKERDVVVARR